MPTVTDRRRERHRETKEEILDAAWELAGTHGIAGISLRDLAARVGMRAPSLYTYFSSKDDLYDAMFSAANQELLAHFDEWSERTELTDPVDRLCAGSVEWIRWCQRSVPRYQLLYTRVIPGWQPSPESYAVASEVFERTRAAAVEAGVASDEDLDLYTAVTGGLAAQQMANDPGGDRWVRLTERAVRRLVATREKGKR